MAKQPSAGGGPIILPPRPASGCDTAIIWDLRINSVTKGRSPRGTDSGDYAGRRKTSSCGETPRFKVNGLPNWEVTSRDNAGPGCRRRRRGWNLPLNGIFSALQTELHPSSEFVNGDNAALSISERIGFRSKSQLH